MEACLLKYVKELEYKMFVDRIEASCLEKIGCLEKLTAQEN
jgi:hypothetical protein